MEMMEGLIQSEKRAYKFTFLEDLLGTCPKTVDIYKEWMISKKPPNAEQDDELESIDLGEKGWTGFMKDENGLFIYNYMIKGFLKNAANVNKHLITVNKTSKKGVITETELFAAKSKFDSYVFIEPRKIYLGKKEPDGTNTRPIRVETMKGPRVAIIKSDFIAAGNSIKCIIEVINNKSITSDIVEQLIAYGKFVGLGQFRNGGYGPFSAERIELN